MNDDQKTTWLVGFGKTEITAWEPELSMMGWGRMDNRIMGVHSPLFARAAAFSDGSKTVVYACIELMAVSVLIRKEVLKRLSPDLELGEHNVMLTATHTHSGPSGYSEYFFMNLNGPGYSPVVTEAAINGTVEAIESAVRGMQSADLRLASQTMPLAEPVAFNRSWFAYNLNEDVEPVTEERRDEIVNRQMTVLAAFLGDTPLGCISWYPVHCTSVHAENDHLHPDNKGLAAVAMEEANGDGFVAVFAQEASGDVTPNYRYDRKRKKVVGHVDNDYEAAAFNGAKQKDLAQTLLKSAASLPQGSVWGATHWVDFSDIEVSERYGQGATQKTTTATLGLSMAEGTAEGPGPILGLRQFNRWLTRRKARAQNTDDPKVPMVDVGSGLDAQFLGFLKVRGAKLPPFDASFKYIRGLIKAGRVEENPWFPQVLPLQLMQIGPVLVVGLPFEATTVAGERIRAQLQTAFESRGVRQVIIGNYSNAYAGYCTTFEEYQLQHYEAGYTLFGPHQLGALQTMLTWMVGRVDDMPIGAAPTAFDSDILLGRRFEKPWPGKRAKKPLGPNLD